MMSIPEAEHEALQEIEELHRQVPELRRELAEEVRKSHESQLALSFNGVSDLLFLIGVEAGPRFRCLAVNHSYIKGTGRTQEQIEGKLLEEILPPVEAQFVIANYLTAMQSRSPTTYEEGADVPAGRLMVETTLTPVFDEQGQCTHLLGASRDITERKRMLKTLRRSEARYRTVSELISDYAYAVRLEPNGRGILEWVTEAFSRITGFTVQDLAAGIGVDRLIHPEDLPRVYQRLRVLFAGRSGVSEHRIVTKGGEVRWLRDYSCPEWDPAQGRVVRVIGAGQDITEWKQTEEALRESEERYRNLFENANDAIATFTLDGAITAVNRAAEQLIGWSREELIGQHVRQVATPASVALAEESLHSARLDTPGCLVLDIQMPDLSGLDLQQALARADVPLPIIFITGHGDIPMAVQAMKAGAVSFLAKPLRNQDLLDAIREAIHLDRAARRRRMEITSLREQYELLTAREREVFACVVAGLLNKQIAEELGTSERTVKAHRSQIMSKLQARSLVDLVRMADKLGITLPHMQSLFEDEK